MRNRIWTAVATVLAVVIAATGLGGSPVDAHHEPLIQPGAPVRLTGSVAGQFGQCTLNLVFRDAIERILHLLDEAGFRVELVTAYDEVVRRGR